MCPFLVDSIEDLVLYVGHLLAYGYTEGPISGRDVVLGSEG